MAHRTVSHPPRRSEPHGLRQAVHEALRPRPRLWAGGLLAASLAAPLPVLGLELSALNGRNGFTLNGRAASDWTGLSVSGAGDVNGDGLADLIIGAPPASPGGRRFAGQAYIVFGRTGGFPTQIELAALDGRTGFALNGIAPGDEAGWSVSGAGDVNGDGVDDLLIATPYASPGGRHYAGQAYVVFGHTGRFPARIELATLDGRNGFTLNGIAAGDLAGSSVSGAGDVNGDGLNDLLVGAPFADADGRIQAGQAYTVFGTRRVPVNNLISFVPLLATFRTSSTTAGCPAGSVGQFRFASRLANVSAQALSDIQVEVTRITAGNLLLSAGGVLGPGGVFEVARVGSYADGVLSPRERVEVPFTVCLKSRQRFRLLTNVFAEISP